MEYQAMLQRFVGRRVCVSTFGQLKLWGRLAAVTDDCLRLVNTSVSSDGEDSSFSAYATDEESPYGQRHAETLVHFHHVVAISCLDDDLPALTLSGSCTQSGEGNALVAQTSLPPNTRTWETVDERATEGDDDPWQLLAVDRVEVQVGTRLVSLVDPRQGGDLRDRLTHLRNVVSAQLGFLLPLIRIRDNLHLEPESYRILVHGAEVARGELEPERILALGGPNVREPLEGRRVDEPAYAQPAIWIEATLRDRAVQAGYFTVEPNTVLVTHLQKEVRAHARELFTLDALRQQLEQLRRIAPAVVDEVVPQRIPLTRLHDLLTRLLEEEVALRPLEFILERVAHLDTMNCDMEELLLQLRMAMGRLLSERFRDASGQLPLFTLDHDLHDSLAHLLLGQGGPRAGMWIAQFVARLSQWYRQRREELGRDLPLVVDTLVRRKAWQLLHRHMPSLAVLAFSEIAHDVPAQLVASLSCEDLGMKLAATAKVKRSAPAKKATRRRKTSGNKPR